MRLRTILSWLIKSLVLVGILSVINYFVLTRCVHSIKVPTSTEIVKDSLVRDTLYSIKDSTTSKITIIKETYEKEKATIMANDTTADMQFFTNYINNYNNSRTIKDN
jgi:hypothetical protein